VTGDLFFDIEGARYYSEDNKEFGLQYLFGIVDTADTDARGRPRYTQIWALDRPDEKRAFEELVDREPRTADARRSREPRQPPIYVLVPDGPGRGLTLGQASWFARQCQSLS